MIIRYIILTKIIWHFLAFFCHSKLTKMNDKKMPIKYHEKSFYFLMLSFQKSENGIVSIML
jgi:hypothetical protein